LAQSCPDGDNAERAFVPYMHALQTRLTQTSCGLNNTLLSAYQIAMLLTMYFNSPTFVGDKLCAAISHGDNEAIIRQVVLYSDSKTWDVGTQNRQTFSANLLGEAQLPWYQFEKIVRHNPTSTIKPRYGEPTSGLPYGDDQISFLGHGNVQVIHSDEPDRDGQYISHPNDLIVYGTPTNDYFNFTSGGSVIAFGGSGRDILAYEVPTITADNSQYIVSYLAGNRDFDYYRLNPLNIDSGEVQINDPDGGTIMLSAHTIAGLLPITISQGKSFSANIALTVEGKKATLDIQVSKPYDAQLSVILFDFNSGDFGLLRREACVTRFSSNEQINPVSAERFFLTPKYTPTDVTVLNLQGSIVNQFKVRTSLDTAPSVLSTQLNNGYISYVFRELTVNRAGPPCYDYSHGEIQGRIYNQDGVETAKFPASSTYPPKQFCPQSDRPNIDICNIEDIELTAGLNAGYQAIVYRAVSRSNVDCSISRPAKFLKIYDTAGKPLPQILELPWYSKGLLHGIYGTSLDKLTMLFSGSDQKYNIYRANLYTGAFQLVESIDNVYGAICLSAYQNGFIITYKHEKTFTPMRTLYNNERLNTQTITSSTACFPYNIELGPNLIMLVDIYGVQLITSTNQNVGPYSSASCSGGAFSGNNIGIFRASENTIRLTSLDRGLHTNDIDITGLSTKFNVPEDFPELPPTSTHSNFPPASAALTTTNEFTTGRSLQSINNFDDISVPSSANRLTPPHLISVLWFA